MSFPPTSSQFHTQAFSYIDSEKHLMLGSASAPTFPGSSSPLFPVSVPIPTTAAPNTQRPMSPVGFPHLILDPSLLLIYGHGPYATGGYSEVLKADLVSASSGDAPHVVAIKVLRMRSKVPVMTVNGLNVGETVWTLMETQALLQEVTPWYSLDHPNVLKLIGYIPDNVAPKLVSLWQSGGTALEYVRANPQADRVDMVRQAAAGLGYLHDRPLPIVHCDIKGDNILVGDDGTVRIADFGLAVIMDPGSHSRSRPYRGTIQYADPSLLQDEANTTLTDLWAFGWTAWEISTLRRPYAELKSTCAIMHAILRRQLPNCIESIQAGVSSRLWSVMQGCWDEVPARRWDASAITLHLGDRID